MSKGTEKFDAICGNCAGIDLVDITVGAIAGASRGGNARCAVIADIDRRQRRDRPGRRGSPISRRLHAIQEYLEHGLVGTRIDAPSHPDVLPGGCIEALR